MPEVRNLVEGGEAPRTKNDHALTRYACYLIVQNGDSRKELGNLKECKGGQRKNYREKTGD